MDSETIKASARTGALWFPTTLLPITQWISGVNLGDWVSITAITYTVLLILNFLWTKVVVRLIAWEASKTAPSVTITVPVTVKAPGSEA